MRVPRLPGWLTGRLAVRVALAIVAVGWSWMLAKPGDLLAQAPFTGLRVLSEAAWQGLCGIEAAALVLPLALPWRWHAPRVLSALYSCAVRGAIAGLIAGTGHWAYGGYAMLAYWLTWADFDASR